MALSDRKILEEMRKGDIVISPFDRRNLATSSYDLTLGEWYFREQVPSLYHHKIYNIWNKDHIDHVWGTKPERAIPAREVFKKVNFEWKGISPDDLVILLAPGETVLAHTNEFIGGRKHITTMMKARSSLGRSFIEVCKCAGWGDVGYINRWTMEVTNNSSHYSIPLVVGRRIAQMVFFETGPIAGADYSKTGKYNPSSNLAVLQKTWKPSAMLPRLDTDRDARAKKAVRKRKPRR
ncbi:MAG TPA: deoxycytidine triphosphate deaminase [Candidatus Paceibacterota bacterium]